MIVNICIFGCGESRGYPSVGQRVSQWLVSQKLCNKKNAGCQLIGTRVWQFKVGTSSGKFKGLNESGMSR